MAKQILYRALTAYRIHNQIDHHRRTQSQIDSRAKMIDACQEYLTNEPQITKEWVDENHNVLYVALCIAYKDWGFEASCGEMTDEQRKLNEMMCYFKKVFPDDVAIYEYSEQLRKGK